MSRPIVRVYTEPSIFIDREMNDREFAQYQTDQAEYEARLASENEVKASKVQAEAKLVALGLDLDDLKALGL